MRSRRRWRSAVGAAVATAFAGAVAIAACGDSGQRGTEMNGAAASTTVSDTASAAGIVVTGPANGELALAESLGIVADPACTPSSEVPAAARQVVVVRSDPGAPSFATVDLLVDTGRGWTCELRDVPARLGRNGVRPLAERRSGDGTTPTGVFALGTMTAPDGETFQMFGNGPDPGVRAAWRQVRPGDCWVATPHLATYNTLTTASASACSSPDEYLPAITGAYSAAALIDANMGPDRSGDQPGEPPLAAAIFLHRFSYDAAGRTRPTSGCVSLSASDLATVLRALQPGEAWFVIS